ncbi:MAG TPA: ABC-type transport auxiliary lipoprotein family protein [Sphingomonadaceae bacterium]
MNTTGGGMTGSLRAAAWPLVLGGALMLSGCISFGKKPPPTLLDLTPAQAAAAGAGAQGTADQAIAVMVPDAPLKLDVTQVPVQVNASTVAYLKGAVWVEKPAQLFARLITETIRAKGTRLVIDGLDARYRAATKLSGQLVEMGYDAPSGSVVVTFDAVLQQPDGQIRTQRFENRVAGVAPTAAAVAPALNQAANQVAAAVAAWVG